MKLPTSIAEIENFLSQISAGVADSVLDLQSILNSASFPLEDISRAQALNTWFRKVPKEQRRPIFTAGASFEEGLKSISSTPLGLITVARGRDWFPADYQKALVAVRNSYFQQMQSWPDLAVTDRTFILCDDSYSKGLPWPLHDRTGSLRGDKYFEGFVPKLVSSVMCSDELRGAIMEQASLLTTLVYELVKNTQDHALFTASGAGIDDSVRLLFVRFYDLAMITIPSGDSPDSPLEPHVAYVKALKAKHGTGMRAAVNKRFRGVLEFSVLDSGPGFVGRRLQRDVSPDEDIDIEYKAVLSCLRAGHSTARNPNRGLGLNDVLRALRAMNGFIRVRTNRLSSYREFKIFSDSKDSEVNPVLHDWRKGYSAKAMSHIEVIQNGKLNRLHCLSKLRFLGFDSRLQ